MMIYGVTYSMYSLGFKINEFNREITSENQRFCKNRSPFNKL